MSLNEIKPVIEKRKSFENHLLQIMGETEPCEMVHTAFLFFFLYVCANDFKNFECIKPKFHY